MNLLPLELREDIFSYLPLPHSLFRLQAVSTDWSDSLPYSICKTLSLPLLKDDRKNRFHRVPVECPPDINITTESEFRLWCSFEAALHRTEDVPVCNCLSILTSVLSRIRFYLTAIKLTYSNDLNLTREHSVVVSYCIISCLRLIQTDERYRCQRLRCFDFTRFYLFSLTLSNDHMYLNANFLLTTHLKVLRFSLKRNETFGFNRFDWLEVLHRLEELQICITANANDSVILPLIAPNLKKISIKVASGIDSIFWSTSVCPQIQSAKFKSKTAEPSSVIDFCRYFRFNANLIQLNLSKYFDTLEWNSCLQDSSICDQSLTSIDSLRLKGGRISDHSLVQMFRNLKRLELKGLELSKSDALMPIFKSCLLIEQLILIHLSVEATSPSIACDDCDDQLRPFLIDLSDVFRLVNLYLLTVGTSLCPYRLPKSQWPLNLRQIELENVKLSSYQLRMLADRCGASLKTLEIGNFIPELYDLHHEQLYFDWEDVGYLLRKCARLEKLRIPFAMLGRPSNVAAVGAALAQLDRCQQLRVDCSVDYSLQIIEHLMAQRQLLMKLPSSNLMPLEIQLDSLLDECFTSNWQLLLRLLNPSSEILDELHNCDRTDLIATEQILLRLLHPASEILVSFSLYELLHFDDSDH